MPGLGDTGLGQEARLIRLLAEDADLLLVRLPQDNRDVWMDFDLDLYRVARDALGDLLPVERWTLLVLNRRAAPTTATTARPWTAPGRRRATSG